MQDLARLLKPLKVFLTILGNLYKSLWYSKMSKYSRFRLNGEIVPRFWNFLTMRQSWSISTIFPFSKNLEYFDIFEYHNDL